MSLDPVTLLALALIVLLAYAAEAALGFGCNVLALTLASPLLPLEELLPVLVGLNLVVSVVILVRHHPEVDRRALLRRILPLAGLGLPVGMLVFALAPGPLLVRGFGAFVLVLALAEGVRSFAGEAVERPPPGGGVGAASLVGSGFFHGLYASGGPLLVWWASRVLPDKASFRATLTAVWLLLNLPLMGGYAWAGALDGTAGLRWLALLPATALGIALGEWAHGRLRERTFLRIVYVLLALGGLTLLAGS